jgi:hypothetical protein
MGPNSPEGTGYRNAPRTDLLILQERFARDIADMKKITSVIITAAFFAASGMSPAMAQAAGGGALGAGGPAGIGAAGGLGTGALLIGIGGLITAGIILGATASDQRTPSSTSTSTSTTGLP